MDIKDYINGDRFGKEAHRLEQEAVYDSFLQDAIDGYDQVKDQPLHHLENIEKQIKKRTGNNIDYLQVVNILASILIIAALIFFFFMYNAKNTGQTDQNINNNNNTGNTNISDSLQATPFKNDLVNTNNPFIASNPVEAKVANKDDSSKMFIPKNDVTFENTAKKQPFYSIKDKSAIYRLLKNLDYGENQNFYWQQEPYQVNSSSSLSNREIQEILARREYNPGYLNETAAYPFWTETAKATNRSSVLLTQTPEPVNGNKAYWDYIEKNRNQFANNTCEKPHGKVILVFKVNEKGRPVDIGILRSLCQTADTEAIQLLKNGPDWTNSNNNGRLEIVF